MSTSQIDKDSAFFFGSLKAVIVICFVIIFCGFLGGIIQSLPDRPMDAKDIADAEAFCKTKLPDPIEFTPVRNADGNIYHVLCVHGIQTYNIRKGW